MPCRFTATRSPSGSAGSGVWPDRSVMILQAKRTQMLEPRVKTGQWQKGLPDTQAKFHILFLFFSASMFSVSLASLFIYHCWLVCKNRSTLEAVRAPVFRHGTDKNGFSLGVSKNFRQVFGDEAKYWPVPVFSSLGDGCSFPTCLVNMDPESPTSSNSASKSSAEGRHQFPSKPLRESQSRLLTSTPSWAENESAADKERKGANNPGMTIENEA